MWIPEVSGGRPLLPNPNAGALYPVRPLLALVPFPLAMRLFPLLHWAFAGAGVLFLVRLLGASSAAAWVAAASYAFSGVAVSGLLSSSCRGSPSLPGSPGHGGLVRWATSFSFSAAVVARFPGGRRLFDRHGSPARFSGSCSRSRARRGAGRNLLLGASGLLAGLVAARRSSRLSSGSGGPRAVRYEPRRILSLLDLSFRLLDSSCLTLLARHSPSTFRRSGRCRFSPANPGPLRNSLPGISMIRAVAIWGRVPRSRFARSRAGSGGRRTAEPSSRPGASASPCHCASPEVRGRWLWRSRSWPG